MSLGTSLVLYLLIGVGVGVAVGVTGGQRSPGELAFRIVLAVCFWPLFMPLLLAGSEPEASPTPQSSPTQDELSAAIALADAELESAFDSLDGWVAHGVLREKGRIEELRQAWRVLAQRIREMDHLLAQADQPLPASGVEENGTGSERVRHLERARRINRERLRQVRNQAHDDLMGNLAWVRELASMIHLAKFTGEPAARAEELVAQIAAAVEGVSTLTRQPQNAF